MKRSYNMLSLILYYIDEEYRNLHPYLSTRNDDFKVSSDILNLASKNKVLHAFLKGVLNEGIDTPKVRSELSYCERQLVKLTDTLQFISGLLGDNGIDFLTIKTFKGVPFATQDVDIFIKKTDLKQVQSLLQKRDLQETNGKYMKILTALDLGSPGFRRHDLLNLDLYTEIPWEGLGSFDHDYLWSNSRWMDLHGIKYRIPNYGADILSQLSSALFTDRKITLLDFIYVTSLLKNVNLDELIYQTSKYGWNCQFTKLITILHSLRKTIYSNEVIPGKIEFPYTIPISLLLESIPGTIHHEVMKRPRSFFSTISKVGFNCFIGNAYVNLKRVANTILIQK